MSEQPSYPAPVLEPAAAEFAAATANGNACHHRPPS